MKPTRTTTSSLARLRAVPSSKAAQPGGILFCPGLTSSNWESKLALTNRPNTFEFRRQFVGFRSVKGASAGPIACGEGRNDDRTHISPSLCGDGGGLLERT